MTPRSTNNLILHISLILFSTVLVSEAQNGVGVNTNTPKSSFEDNGSFGKKVTTITANTTLDDTYASVICNNGAVAIAVTLPTASTCAARVYEIKRNASSTANVTVTATIDGVANYVLTQAGQSITVFSDGTNWQKRDGQGGEWSINGNAGTVAGTNFLGTIDAIDFVLKTSATERLRVLSTGNVGINETSPSTILHVSQNSSTVSTMPVILQNNGGSSNPGGTEVVLRLSPSSSETVRGADIAALNTGANAIDMKFLTCNNNSPTEKVRITSLGLVGIGTSKPLEKLHVSGNIQLGDSIGPVAVGKRLEFSQFYINTDPVAIYRVNTAADNTTLRFELGDNGSAGGPGEDYFDFCAFNTTAAPAVRIATSVGNMGINVLNPTSRLHVVASGTAKITDYAGTFLSNTATSTQLNVDKKGLEITSTGTWTGTNATNIGLHVSSVTGGTANYDAVFNGGGNVGIGTATPTEYLHIFNNTAPFVLLESNGGSGKTMAYKVRPWSGMAANTYVGFGGIDDGASSARAAIFVPNTANTGVTEAVSILKSSGNMGIGTTSPKSNLEINGSFAANITIATLSPTLDGTNHIVVVTGGTVTLPAANTATKRIYHITNKTGGAITIGNYLNLSNATVNSVATFSAVSLVSDGTNWIQYR